MKLRPSLAQAPWSLALLVTNAAVLVAMLVLVAAGQIHSFADFLRGWAYGCIFANLTAALGVLITGPAIGKRTQRRQSMLPVVAASFILVVPLGCLAATLLLVALHLASPTYFWAEYWHTLRTVMPLAVVFGLGAFVHASLAARLQAAERELREKELAEQRALKLAAETRLRSLEAWIHPHFLFNTLNTISALIAVDPVRAEQIVGRFANLLRTSLDGSHRSLIPLRQELAFVESYVDIERVRLGDRLRARFEIAEGLGDVLVPPMALQSLIENAIKHGINPLPTGGELAVTARECKDRLSLAVRDSGAGFDLASIPAEHGLDKLVQRLDALYGGAAAIQVSRQENVCVVEMLLPRS